MALPSGYTELTFIESSGTQYIDTGVNGNNDNLTISFKYELLSYTRYGGLFGNYVNETHNCWRILQTANDNNKCYVSVNSSAGSGTSTITLEKNVVNTVEVNNTQCIINGVVDPHSTTTKGTVNDTNIVIFAQKATTGSKMRLYNFKIIDGNNVVRDYVPAMRETDEVIGLYDKITKSFYTNGGSGVFIAGDVVPNEPEYIIEIVSVVSAAISPNPVTVNSTIKLAVVIEETTKKLEPEIIYMNEIYMGEAWD